MIAVAGFDAAEQWRLQKGEVHYTEYLGDGTLRHSFFYGCEEGVEDLRRYLVSSNFFVNFRQRRV